MVDVIVESFDFVYVKKNFDELFFFLLQGTTLWGQPLSEALYFIQSHCHAVVVAVVQL